jgi:hypothetical protein
MFTSHSKKPKSRGVKVKALYIVREIPDTHMPLRMFVRTSLPTVEGLSKPQAFPVCRRGGNDYPD